jgi:hypothetical protein
MRNWTVRPVRADEFEAWTRLFRGYADFYQCPTSDKHQRQIWSWIHDVRSVEALVAVPLAEAGNESGEAQGLAHLREWVRPLRGVVCGYLDRLALERGWPVVHWTTADDNYPARSAYDRIAVRTTWLTYDMTAGATLDR